MSLFTFFNPRVLRAHGGSGYTFGRASVAQSEKADFLSQCFQGKSGGVCVERQDEAAARALVAQAKAGAAVCL